MWISYYDPAMFFSVEVLREGEGEDYPLIKSNLFHECIHSLNTSRRTIAIYIHKKGGKSYKQITSNKNLNYLLNEMAFFSILLFLYFMLWE